MVDLKDLIKSDEVLSKLAVGNIKDYPSKIHAEMAYISRLLDYSISKKDMNDDSKDLIPLSHWQNQPEEYRLILIDAVRRIKSDDSAITFQEEEDMGGLMKIVGNTHYVIAYPGDPTYFHVLIADKRIELKDAELLSSKAFLTKYLREFFEIIQLRKGDWQIITEYWLSDSVLERKTREDMSDQQEIIEAILRFLKSCLVVDKIDDCIKDDNRIHCKKGKIFVPTRSIKHILKIEGGTISSRKLRVLMSDYILENTTSRTIDEKPFRFWVFDAKKVKIREDEKIELEDYKEDAD